LTATIRKGKLADVNPIRAELRVQACTDEICLPPATLLLVVSRQQKAVAALAGGV
jgi:hypothetical protein